MNKALIVILSAVMLDAIGIGLIFPILPQLLREVTQANEITLLYGVMIALYAFMQFIFSPVLGVLSDRFGRRPVLLISLAGAALDYTVMTFTPELWILLVGRALAGLTSANMAVAVAYLTDITPKEQRAERFGYLHAMFGIGFIIGPVLGGVLGEYWVRAPFLAAAVFNLLNFVIAYFVLPESRPGQKFKLSIASLNPFKLLRWSVTIRALVPFVIIFLILNFVAQVYGSLWVLYAQDIFEWTPLFVGMSLASFGLFHALFQGFLPGPIVRRFGEKNAFLIGMSGEVLALIIMSFLTQGLFVFALLPLFAIGGVGMPALQSLATQVVDEDQQGRLQGVLSSLTSVTAIVAPLFFSIAYFTAKSWWAGSVWLIAAALYLAVLPFVLNLKPGAPQAAAAGE